MYRRIARGHRPRSAPGYRATLQFDRRHLLERFELVDMARKVVGVGSVGTRAFIGLLQGRDDGDPLFLQVKEATASVLEDYLPKSRFTNSRRTGRARPAHDAGGKRHLPGLDQGREANRYLYWRQLRDMKGSALVETMAPGTLKLYAGFCGWTLARAHARSGDAIALAAVPWQDRRVRSGDHRLLRALRGSKRSGLPGVWRGHRVGSSGGRRRPVRFIARPDLPVSSLAGFKTDREARSVAL